MAYDEEDDGFRFTRTRAKKAKAAVAQSVPEPVPEEKEEAAVAPTHAYAPAPAPENRQPPISPTRAAAARDERLRKRNKGLTATTATIATTATTAAPAALSVKKQRPPKQSREQRPPPPPEPEPAAEPEPDPDPDPAPDIAPEAALRVKTDGKKRKKAADARTKVAPEPPAAAVNVATAIVEDTRIIALPLADTPVISRNRDFRHHGGLGASSSKKHRRSSTGWRGRRASSLIDSGSDG